MHGNVAEIVSITACMHTTEEATDSRFETDPMSFFSFH